MRKPVLSVLILIAALLLVAACARATSTPTPVPATPTPTPKSLTWGCVSSMTGPASHWAIGHCRGGELGAIEINKAGGIKIGGDTYLIKWVQYDDKFQVPLGIAAANRLVFDDKAIAVWNSQPGVVEATVPIFEANKIINFFPVYGEGVLGPQNPFTFGTHVTPWENTFASLRYIKDKFPEVKTMAFVNIDVPFGHLTQKVAKWGAEQFGLEMVFSELVEMGTTDFYPILLRLLDKKPDIIHPSLPVGLFMKQAREAGLQSIGWFSAPLDPVEEVELAGKENMEGFVTTSLDPMDPLATAEYKALYDKYMAKYGPPFNQIVISFYDAAMNMWKAYERAGSLEPEKVVAALLALSDEGKLTSVMGAPAFYGGEKRHGIPHQWMWPDPIAVIRDGVAVGEYMVSPAEMPK